MKIVMIYQSNCLLWPGFFGKIKYSDCFTLLDNVKYTKNTEIKKEPMKNVYE